MKEWQNLMEGFCGSQRSRPLFSSSSSSSSRQPKNSQRQEQVINWSSSDDDESKQNSLALASSVVVRLNFETSVPRPSGVSKATISRDINLSAGLELENSEGSKSPVFHKRKRETQSIESASDIFAETQDDLPTSPILEVKKRLSPVLRRKRRNLDLFDDPKTPTKESPGEDLSCTSPVFTVKRRKSQYSRHENIPILEVESQKEEVVGEIEASPAKSPVLQEKSTISPVRSPVINKQTKQSLTFKITRSTPQLSSSSSEGFQIVDDSQENGETGGREFSIESPVSQDKNNPNSKAITIQSISSASDAASRSQLPSAASSETSDVPDFALPIDPTQKTRKRPHKNGLVERLKKLQTRQQSLFRMWHHERQSGGKQMKGLVLQIQTLSSFGHKVLASGTFTKSVQKIAILFDQEQVKREGIKSTDFVKIYPPWQTFETSHFEVPIIMSLNLFEKVEQPPDFVQFDSIESTENLKEFSCFCSTNPDVPHTDCTLLLPKKGKEVMEMLLKSGDSSKSSKLRACEELESTNEEAKQQSQNQLFTISDALDVYSRKSTAPLHLKLACQRIFVSKKIRRKEISHSLTQISQNFEHLWVMLGQDANEVLCFVELKGDFREKVIEGGSYFFKGLNLIKRMEIAGKPDIVGLLAGFSSEGKQTMSIFKFSTTRGSMLENLVSVQPWVPPVLCKLCFVNKATNGRLSLAMKFLSCKENRLFCTDTFQIKQEIPYLTIPIKPQTVINKFPAGAIIFLRDLLCIKGDISADDFTCIYDIENPPSSIQLNSNGMGPVMEWIQTKLLNQAEELKNAKPEIPNLCGSSEVHQLVSLEGTICEVDEDNSYSWPVCGNCSSEFLQDLPDGAMCCSICRSEGPFTNIAALSVFISPSQGFKLPNPETKILVKLLHETVEILLPRWNQEEYGLEAVLGQAIGPIVCCLLNIEEGKTVSLSQVPY